jgi:VWFA-related protein
MSRSTKSFTVLLLVSSVVIGGASLVVGSGPAQSFAQEIPTFRVAVEQIELAASVRDREGRFIRDLTKADFEVFEDGQRQDVDAVALVNISMRRGLGSDSTPINWPEDTASNAWVSRSRVYLMVLDGALVEPKNSPSVQRAARQFVEQHLDPEDLLAVVSTNDDQNTPFFTRDRELALSRIEQFHGTLRRENGIANEVAMTQILERLDWMKNGGQPPKEPPKGIRQSRPKSLSDPEGDSERRSDPWLDPSARGRDAEEAYFACLSAKTLRVGAEFMSQIPARRRAIVLLSEGVSYDVDDLQGQDAKFSDRVRDAIGDAIGAATRANVAIYAVDPRGVAVRPPTQVEMDASKRRLGDPFTRGLESLRRYGDETGGFAAMSNDFGETFRRIVREQSEYYVIGYRGSPQKTDGRFHRIEVRVVRPGAYVTTRPGYVAPSSRAARAYAESVRAGRDRFKGDASSGADVAAAVASLLARPIPTAGLGIRIQAIPLKAWRTESADTLVAVEIEDAALAARQIGEKLTNAIDVGVAAVDEHGSVRCRQDAVLRLSFRRDLEVSGLAPRGARWVSRLNLPPGRYQIRVAAREQVGGREGAAFTELNLQDFSHASSTLSGVMLTSMAAPLLPTMGWLDVNRWHLPQPITAKRVFTDADVLTATAELYDDEGEPQDARVTARVLSSTGEELMSMGHTFTPSDRRDGRYVSRVQLPLVDMPPGAYVLQIEARSGRSVTSATRIVPFEVVAGAGSVERRVGRR